MHRTNKYYQLCSVTWSVWPNGSVFVYKISGCGFESRWSNLNFRKRTCLEEGVPWHSSKHEVWIHCKTRTWHDNNIQSNAAYRWVSRIEVSHLVSLAKLLSARLQTKSLWVKILVLSLKPQISRLFQAKSSLTFSKTECVDLLWNAYVTW